MESRYSIIVGDEKSMEKKDNFLPRNKTTLLRVAC